MLNTKIEKSPLWELSNHHACYMVVLLLGLVHTAGWAEPNWTDSAWKTNLHYEMEAFTLHAEPNRTERVHWLMFAFTHQLATDSVAQ